MAKKQDKYKIFTKIIAIILVVSTVLGVSATLIYTLFSK